MLRSRQGEGVPASLLASISVFDCFVVVWDVVQRGKGEGGRGVGKSTQKETWLDRSNTIFGWDVREGEAKVHCWRRAMVVSLHLQALLVTGSTSCCIHSTT